MKAARVLHFGPPSVIENDDLPRPEPADGQLLVRVDRAERSRLTVEIAMLAKRA